MDFFSLLTSWQDLDLRQSCGSAPDEAIVTRSDVPGEQPLAAWRLLERVFRLRSHDAKVPFPTCCTPIVERSVRSLSAARRSSCRTGRLMQPQRTRWRPSRSCRVRGLDQPLRDPPDVSIRILDAALSIPVGHVTCLHLQFGTGRDSLRHSLVSILDVKIER